MSEGEQSPKSALNEVVTHWKSSCLDEAQPPSKTQEDLQTDAKTFFRYLSKSTKVVTDSNLILETRSSHEEAVAKLIQDLGPSFTATHQSRVRALHVLVGAIEGCRYSQLSNKITHLIGKFLIGHCGPIDDDDYGEDYDNMIRDAAVLGLTGLTQTPTTGKSDGEILEALRMRMEFSWQGVDHRCAAPEMDESEDIPGYGSTRNLQDIRGGLSSLPRSKRSLCFDLLRSTVTGVTAITNQMQSPLTESLLPSLQTQLVEFTRFASNCIHGESDPRCLMQLLELLHAIQVAFAPWFVSFTTPDNIFPTEELFDAVAAYYPIQFTPPPNNIHGITREGLRSALLAVLCFTKMDVNAQEHNRHGMLGLSAGLVLEQLLPMPAEDNPITVEKLDALECLSALLFPKEGKSLCERLEVSVVRNLSVALKATHDESSMGISQGGDKGDQNKLLADTCRTFVSKVAFQLEIAANKALWEAFVSETLQKQVTKLKLSPEHARTSIAYIACLTASGGPRTLRSCLAMGLEPLMEHLSENLEDSENAVVAAHGIGAFFSSCRVAMDRAKKEGVVLHPHPLDPYAEKACQILMDAFDSEGGKLSLSIKIGAVRALESLLLASSQEQLQIAMLERICSFIETLLDSVTTEKDPSVEWQEVCCMSLGSILGASLEPRGDATGAGTPPDTSPSSLMMSELIQDCVRKRVYPALLDFATKGVKTTRKERCDRKALAIACSSSRAVAKSVVSSILESLNGALKENILDQSCVVCAEALSYTLQNGGDFSLRAYHDSPVSGEILDTLSDGIKTARKAESRGSVANLALPATTEEQEALQMEIDAISRLVGDLLPAYKKFVPKARLMKLLKGVSNIIPPLSEADNFSLCIRLPVLGAALYCSTDNDSDADTMETDESMEVIANSMLAGLTEYVLSNDYDTRARSAAASCVHATITLGRARGQECPVIPLVTNVINPAIASAIDMVSVKDCLNLLALVGSAAACRGVSSSSTADKIARFLVELASTGKSLLPFSPEGGDCLDSSTFDENPSLLQITAASAYGSMLSVDGVKPLMKQRLSHISLKFIRLAYEEERDQARTGQTVVSPQIGLLAIVCHVICCNDLSKIDRSTQHQLATLATEGLSSTIFLSSEGRERTLLNVSAAKNLVLAAILKLICVAPSSVPLNGFLLTLVTGLLRAYAISDPSSEVASKLLALQALEGMAHMEGARVSATAVRPAVVEVLAAAMNHPSGLLRQAAVDVRNAWYVLDY